MIFAKILTKIFARKLSRQLSIALLIFAGLSACAWLPDQIDLTEDWTAQQFYLEGKDALKKGNYDIAIENFEKLQARFPFGRYAQQAQIELIYAHYKSGQPDSAIAAADRFIRTHPRHPFVDYAYYLKGLVNYNRGVGLIERLLPSDPSKTDTSSAQQSFNDFAELVQKFPNSKYAEDSRQRMLFLRNNLATYENNVADFYIRRKAYVAAVNRAKYVLENYSTTPAVADALANMTKAYIALGMLDLARDSFRVLEINHPDSPHIPVLTAMLNGAEPPPGEEESLFSLFSFKLP